jgi:hypothetical protein
MISLHHDIADNNTIMNDMNASVPPYSYEWNHIADPPVNPNAPNEAIYG